MGNLLDRLKKSFVQTSLHAATADAPAVMTASGWKHDNKGNLYQDKKAFEKGSPEEELRNNLAVLGGITLGATAAPVIIPALDTALMPTTRAMYSPYTKNIYKGAAKRFGLDVVIGSMADNVAEDVGYNWQAMTGLPEYIADVTDPLYWGIDRYIDLGPVNVNKQIRKTVKDGVKKGSRKVKETVTDLFTPKHTVQPIETYQFGGPFRRVLRKGVEEVIDKVSDKVQDYASRATKGILDLSEEAMARRTAEIEARTAAMRKELNTDQRVQQAYEKLVQGDIKSGIDEAITRQMKEVDIPNDLSTEGHGFSYNDNGVKTSVQILPKHITGAYDWALGDAFNNFKKALRKKQNIRPRDWLFDDFTRRYKAKPPTDQVHNVPTGTYKGEDVKGNGKVIVGTNSDELPLIFDRGNAQIDHFRWNGLKKNSYISGFTKDLKLEALRKGYNGQFNKLSEDESLSSIHELGNEVQAQLWNYLSTYLRKPATVDQYYQFVDELASHPKFREYLSQIHGGMYQILPINGKYQVGPGAQQVKPETLKNWLKLFGTAGAIATQEPSNYVEQRPINTDVMYRNGGTIKKRF